MTRATLSTAAWVMALAIAGGSMPAQAQAPAAAADSSVAQERAVAAPSPAAGLQAVAAAPRKSTTSRTPAAARNAMPRTLSDVHIEGEIPVPQVLFITARDQRRYMDFQHHHYLKTSLQLGASTPFPTWVAVVNGTPVNPRKEHSR